jgi:hypothetical protein
MHGGEFASPYSPHISVLKYSQHHRSIAMKLVSVVFLSLATSITFTLPAAADVKDMSFFVTSVGLGDGGNLGGLDGADAHCNALAKAAGSPKSNWKAYLSTTAPKGEAGVNARDRIGKGPWMSFKGEVIASSVEELHSAASKFAKSVALDEKGETVMGRGDEKNQHDMLTGSDPQGLYSTAGGDTTCKNWTSNGEGSAIVGHHDLVGLKDTRHMKSWNSSHGSAGCSQEALVKTGGAGLFYCFAAE